MNHGLPQARSYSFRRTSSLRRTCVRETRSHIDLPNLWHDVPAGLDFCPVCALFRAGGNDSAPGEALNPVSDSRTQLRRDRGSSIVRRFENYEVMLGQNGESIELGRGAMGVTYKAFDIDLRFPVTLKVISEKYGR